MVASERHDSSARRSCGHGTRRPAVTPAGLTAGLPSEPLLPEAAGGSCRACKRVQRAASRDTRRAAKSSWRARRDGGTVATTGLTSRRLRVAVRRGSRDALSPSG